MREATRPRWRRLLARALSSALLLLVLVVGVGVMTGRSFSNGPLPSTLEQASALTVTTLDGTRTQLGKLTRPGVPTIISMWASWCGPCRMEAPVLADLRRRHGPARLNFLYINGREPDATLQERRAFVSEMGLPQNDAASMNDATLTKLTRDRANLIPRTYFFDRDGMPKAMIVG